MLGRFLAFCACFALTALFAGCADFEYSEPGVYGYYEPHYYYDRYPRYYHGPQPRNYVHAYRPAPRGLEHPHPEHADGHDGHR